MDKAWVMQAIEQIGQLERGQHGVSRLAFTEADVRARNYIMELMKTEGLAVRVDPIGNIIGRWDTDAVRDQPSVVTGSHLDTVPNGGLYDGVVGVIGALAAVRRLRERQPLSYPLEVVVFAAEESSRFGFAAIGSKTMAGLANSRTWQRAQDQDGVTLAEALSALGLRLEEADQAVRAPQSVKAFVELHIEQGRLLENDNKKIGIAEYIAGPTRCKITVQGEAAHSGTTPMDERQDALVSAAMIVLAVHEIALEDSYSATVATVGAMKVSPGVINVVPGLVEMWVDIRGTEHARIIETLQEIKDAISTIADTQNTPVSMAILSSEKPVKLQEEVSHIIETVCQQQKIAYQYMNSKAGHDAASMAHLAPSGMIFIPVRAGISHNPAEYADPEDIMRGIDVLTETLYELAK